MQAITFEGNEKALVQQEITTPEPGPGELLLKVKACGICGSDLHAYQNAMIDEGTVMGHEFSGEVTAIGPDVSADWKVGDRAISMGALSCGTCENCQNGKTVECEALRIIGFTTPGAYAQYVIVQANHSMTIPDAIEYDQAALVEPLAVGLNAVRDCNLPLGGNILIIGAGIIGITVAKWARFFGAGNIGISDLESARLERAAKAGATLTINAREHANAVQAFQEATGTLPDVIVECVGIPILQQLIDIAPSGMHIVSVGVGMEPEQLIPAIAGQKKIRMTFSFAYQPQDFEFVLRMLESGRMKSSELITQSVSLDQMPQMFADLQKPNDHCKVMIQP